MNLNMSYLWQIKQQIKYALKARFQVDTQPIAQTVGDLMDNIASLEEIANLFSVPMDRLTPFLKEAYRAEPELRQFFWSRAPRLADANSNGIFRVRDTFVTRGFLCYMLVRLMRPSLVMETGVNGGCVSFCVLMALWRNACEGFQKGRLVSFDLEPYPNAGTNVPAKLHELWELMVGDSLERLPEWLAGHTDHIDLFISDTAPEAYRLEIQYVKDRIRRNGLILNHAFGILWHVLPGDTLFDGYLPIIGFHDKGHMYKARAWQKK